MLWRRDLVNSRWKPLRVSQGSHAPSLQRGFRTQGWKQILKRVTLHFGVCGLTFPSQHYSRHLPTFMNMVGVSWTVPIELGSRLAIHSAKLYKVPLNSPCSYLVRFCSLIGLKVPSQTRDEISFVLLAPQGSKPKSTLLKKNHNSFYIKK